MGSLSKIPVAYKRDKEISTYELSFTALDRKSTDRLKLYRDLPCIIKEEQYIDLLYKKKNLGLLLETFISERSCLARSDAKNVCFELSSVKHRAKQGYTAYMFDYLKPFTR